MTKEFKSGMTYRARNLVTGLYYANGKFKYTKYFAQPLDVIEAITVNYSFKNTEFLDLDEYQQELRG